MIYALRGQGNAYWSLKQSDSALHVFQEALKVSQSIQNRRLISSISNRLGYIYKKWGENEKAYIYIQEAITYSPEFEWIYGYYPCRIPSVIHPDLRGTPDQELL